MADLYLLPLPPSLESVFYLAYRAQEGMGLGSEQEGERRSYRSVRLSRLCLLDGERQVATIFPTDDGLYLRTLDRHFLDFLHQLPLMRCHKQVLQPVE